MKYLFGLYLAFSVFFSSLTMLFYQNINQILFSISEDHKMTYSFREDTTFDQAEAKAIEIKNKFNLKSAVVITPADQYIDFIKSFAMYNQGAFEAEEILKLIPHNLELTLFADQNRERIHTEILAENTFQDNETSSLWMDKLKSFSILIERVGRFLFLFLFTSTALMTAATIRVMIFQNEKRILIQSYLGQSYASILKAYLLNTAFLCLAGISFGFLLSYAAFQILIVRMNRAPEFSFLTARFQFLDLKSVLILCSGFFIAYLAGSFFSYQKMYDRIYNED